MTDQATGRTHRYRSYGPGAILDVPKNLEYEFPTIGADAARMVEVLRAELRSIAARLVMPEFMLTSDASNAAYASTMVAEGPAVRNFQRLQAAGANMDLQLMRRIVANAARAGRLPSNVLSLVRISAEGPDPQVREYFKQHQVLRIAHANGVLSPQTWSQKLGLDYEHEHRQLSRHRKDFPAHAAAGEDDPASAKMPPLPRTT